MKRVSFHELAERELNDAALYYEQESTGLGVKFLDEVEGNIGHCRSGLCGILPGLLAC